MNFHSYISRRYPNLPEKIRAYIDLVRPFTLLAPALMGICFGVFALIVSTDVELSWTTGKLLVYGAVTLVLINCASNIWNQVCEVDLDRINKPNRPIPAGRVDAGEAGFIAGVLYLVAMARGFTINYWFSVGTTLLVVITVAYSHRRVYLKKRFVVNNLSIALARGYIGPWMGWCLFGDPFHPVVHAACLMLAAWTFGVISTKDISDMEGDRQAGIRTFPVVLGLERTKPIIAVSVQAPFLLMLTFVRLGVWGWSMLWFFLLWPLGAVMMYLIWSGKDAESIVENKVSWLLMYIQFNAMLLSFPLIYLLA